VRQAFAPIARARGFVATIALQFRHSPEMSDTLHRAQHHSRAFPDTPYFDVANWIAAGTHGEPSASSIDSNRGMVRPVSLRMRPVFLEYFVNFTLRSITDEVFLCKSGT
jgi:hypothetical protein